MFLVRPILPPSQPPLITPVNITTVKFTQIVSSGSPGQTVPLVYVYFTNNGIIGYKLISYNEWPGYYTLMQQAATAQGKVVNASKDSDNNVILSLGNSSNVPITGVITFHLNGVNFGAGNNLNTGINTSNTTTFTATFFNSPCSVTFTLPQRGSNDFDSEYSIAASADQHAMTAEDNGDGNWFVTLFTYITISGNYTINILSIANADQVIMQLIDPGNQTTGVSIYPFTGAGFTPIKTGATTQANQDNGLVTRCGKPNDNINSSYSIVFGDNSTLEANVKVSFYLNNAFITSVAVPLASGNASISQADGVPLAATYNKIVIETIATGGDLLEASAVATAADITAIAGFTLGTLSLPVTSGNIGNSATHGAFAGGNVDVTLTGCPPLTTITIFINGVDSGAVFPAVTGVNTIGLVPAFLSTDQVRIEVTTSGF